MGLAEEQLPGKGNLQIIYSCSGLWGSSLRWATITQQRRRDGCVLRAPNQHAGNTALSLWHGQSMNLGKSKPWDCHDHLQKCLTTSQTREEQVLSLLKQAESHNSFLSSYSCALGKETGKGERGSAAPSCLFTSSSWVTWEEPCLLLISAKRACSDRGRCKFSVNPILADSLQTATWNNQPRKSILLPPGFFPGRNDLPGLGFHSGNSFNSIHCRNRNQERCLLPSTTGTSPIPQQHQLTQEILTYLQQSLWRDFRISSWMFFSLPPGE